jgi:hypothetical protein
MPTAAAKKSRAVAPKRAKAAPARTAKVAPVRKDVKAPSDAELAEVLGEAWPVWTKLMAAMEQRFAPLERVWFPSKTLFFGKYCRLMRKDRTFLWLLPDRDELKVMIGLGDRAYHLAMESSLPERFKKMFSEAKVYAEGRFGRFAAKTSDVAAIVKSVELKTTPK